MKTICQEQEGGTVASCELTVRKLNFVTEMGNVLMVVAAALWQRPR